MSKAEKLVVEACCKSLFPHSWMTEPISVVQETFSELN